MLKKIIVKNFALIEELELELHPGFNALTGETGAGKSIIIDAVDVVMGGQGLSEYIRSGEEFALIEAFFDVTGNEKITKVLSELNLLPDDEDFLILSRELVRSGKNVSRINGRHVNLSVYKEVTRNLVDIYGQHHQQSLLDPLKHIELLDEFGGPDLIALKEQLAEIFSEYSTVKSKLDKMRANEKEQARMLDIYKYQLDEIEKGNLEIGEEKTLTETKKKLANSEKLSYSSLQVYELLYGESQSASNIITEALRGLKDIVLIDPKMQAIYDNLEAALYQVEEVAREIKHYESTIEADPQQLEEIENRLMLINNLKKKYGNSIEEILEYRTQIGASLEQAENWEEETERLEKRLQEIQNQYNQAAGTLSRARKKTAVILALAIKDELKDLSIPHVSFEVRIDAKSTPRSTGMDEIEFLISPNVGEPLKPLAKIVSGGEVSRIMLAFKAILANADSISTMIFDEVDAGVGGIALQAVAKKLAFIGRSRQVICVTHSPHIAAKADHHYQIVKCVDNSRTITNVSLLSKEQRIEETARMLAGDKITELTRKHAEEILISANDTH